MTNDNEHPEAINEPHEDPVYGPGPAPAAPQAPGPAPVAAAAPAPAVERSRWRPSRGAATIAGAVKRFNAAGVRAHPLRNGEGCR